MLFTRETRVALMCTITFNSISNLNNGVATKRFELIILRQINFLGAPTAAASPRKLSDSKNIYSSASPALNRQYYLILTSTVIPRILFFYFTTSQRTSLIQFFPKVYEISLGFSSLWLSWPKLNRIKMKCSRQLVNIITGYL